MTTLIVTLSVILSILLILTVLIQDGKSGGFTSSASSASQLMGVKKTTDILERLTYTFVGAIMLVSISTGIFTGQDVAEGELKKTVNMENAGPATFDKPAAKQPAADQNGTPATTADSAKK